MSASTAMVTRPRSLMVHAICAAAMMATCLWLAQSIVPTTYWADQSGMPDLENVVPVAFGDWSMSKVQAVAIVNPQQQASLDAIYDRVLARTYVQRTTGRYMMLSLAYGRDQSTRLQAHAPEACYSSNGYTIDQLVPSDIRTPLGNIPVMQMQTHIGRRVEPVTYWFRVADQVARGSYQRNMVRMRTAAKGYIADGLLFRVSEVSGAPSSAAFEAQAEFVREILAAMSAQSRSQVLGAMPLQQ